MLNIPCRIIDPHSNYFGCTVRILGIQRNFEGRVTSYLCQSQDIGEIELQPHDVQRHFNRRINTQLELFHE